jgi:hypothetical protein
MGKFNLSEAAKEILDASVASKRAGQDSPKRLPASVAYGTHEAGVVGRSPTKKDDDLPDYLKGTPQATPPGATPPVGAQGDGVGASKPSGQPQETMGRADLIQTQQDDSTSYENLRDRKKHVPAPQTMKPNPGATLQAYGEELDMSDDVAALLEGENLSEEFKVKATTIFEAAVTSRIEAIAEEIEHQLVEQFDEKIEEIKEDLASKVDDYLNYMVEEWVKENELAIESGLRAEIVEDFIGGLRNLFVEHYIDIPTEKVDVVEELTNKVEELESSLNEEINRGVELKKQLNEQMKLEAIHAACDGLTQTQVEKLKSLAEGVEFTTEDEFAEKLETLKASYFKSDVKQADSSALDDEVLIEDDKKKPVSSDPLMEQYARTISQTLTK